MQNWFFFSGSDGVQVEEIWSLDKDTFTNLKYVLCIVIFLLKPRFCKIIWEENQRNVFYLSYVQLETVYLNVISEVSVTSIINSITFLALHFFYYFSFLACISIRRKI